VDEVHRLRDAGRTRQQIADDLGLPIVSIHRALRGAAKLPKEVRRAHHAVANAVAYPPGTTAEILRLREQGMKRSEIARQVGVSVDKVISDVQKYGAGALSADKFRATRARKYTPAQADDVVRLRRDGVSISQVSAQTGVAEGSVRAILSQHEVTLTTEQRRAAAPTWAMHAIGDYLKKILPEGGEMLTPYTTNTDHAQWRCANGHEFTMTPQKVQSGQWCVACSGHNRSRPQEELRDFLKDLVGEVDVLYNDRTIIHPRELDIVVPTRKIAVEFHGLHWHGEWLDPENRFKTTKKHADVAALGMRLVTVFEDEWLVRRHAVEAYFRGILGSKDRVGARSCSLDLGALDHAAFVERWHLQGAARGVSYGLRQGGELVAVAVFARPNASHGSTVGTGVWELARYCVGPTSVTGGLSRLIAAFKREHPDAERLVSYSDNRWSVGGVYRACGFQETGTTTRSYWYFKKNSRGPRFHRFTFNKQKLLASLPNCTEADVSKTEWQLAQEQGWDRIWDAGTTRWDLDLRAPTPS